jgi:hypothetical protein
LYCNIIFKKCITKFLAIILILVNRLFPCLDGIISPNQTAFIPNRSIVENVLLAQEVVKNYHKNEGKLRCTIKVDLMKAYDSVDLEFVLQCLISLGAHLKFINWICECITSPRFFIALNSTLVGYFEGRRGLRQRYPISPYPL